MAFQNSSDSEELTPWYLRWFGKDYLNLYLHRDDNEAKAQIEFLKSHLKWSPQMRFVDIACGPGRHLKQLAKLEPHYALGIDASKVLLQKAQSEVMHLPNITLAQADMRSIPALSGSFDVALSMFTSFGYFQTDNEHIELLKEWRRVLCQKGVLVIDYINKDVVIGELPKDTESEHDGTKVTQKRRLSEDGLRVEKQIQLSKPNVLEEFFTESVRLYEANEMKALLESASFRVLDVLGGFLNTPFTKTSNRCVVIAEAV